MILKENLSLFVLMDFKKRQILSNCQHLKKYLDKGYKRKMHGCEKKSISKFGLALFVIFLSFVVFSKLFARFS